MNNKKINNKGITLVELIVSIAIVGVAVIYFFQTLYTVKKVYATARDETNEFVAKDYALRLLDAYLDKNNCDADRNICNKYGIECKEITKNKVMNNVFKFKIEPKENDESYYLYKYCNSSNTKTNEKNPNISEPNTNFPNDPTDGNNYEYDGNEYDDQNEYDGNDDETFDFD